MNYVTVCLVACWTSGLKSSEWLWQNVWCNGTFYSFWYKCFSCSQSM